MVSLLVSMKCPNCDADARANAPFCKYCGRDLKSLLARNHDERFLGLMDRQLPTWRRLRTELNAAPLANEAWKC